ncbi:duf928-containing protein [Leptolyngbya sp. Heron Island J]|uniref:DUF928 domain-containing protein n=1 Tax=Leptolyngbya sp. Heron Island J TaxID=1385935 RepID=UPI0003B9B7B0|nr:DUF928 domain-containing protein [Leptolyngbya sp. Heron Island J]ESA36161.1 duf928-containing protein [Leptolyngbya sp. Heron Island J]
MSIPLRCIPAALATLIVVGAGPSYALEFPQTRDRGAPARGPSMATRGEICLDPQNRPSLTSLLPHNAIATAFGADTNIPMALWFYIPETVAAGAELTIVNELGDEIFQQAIALPETPGTLPIDLPRYQADGVTPTFASGSLYYWDFALICDPDDRGDDVLLGGGIQRLDASPDFLAELNAVANDPLAQAELYAAAGAWQETIALAASIRSQNPTAWAELLTSVDLDSVAAQPILGQDDLAGEVPARTPTATPNHSSDLQQLLDGINHSGAE